MRSEEFLSNAYTSILQNDFEQAIHWFEEALAIEPNDGDIHYRCSITYARSNRLEKAIQHAKEAVLLSPDQKIYIIHFERLQALEMTLVAKKILDSSDGNTKVEGEELIRILQKAVELDPISIDAKFWLAVAYGEMKQYDLALHALSEAKALLQDESIVIGLSELEQRFKTLLLNHQAKE